VTLKAGQSGDFSLGGSARGNGARAPLGALLLGYWDGKALRYAGQVGSGLDEASIAALLERSADLKRADSPFAERPPLHRPTTWLAPKLVAEVSYKEWTPARALRAPVFLRLRDDIDPRSVRRPEGRADTSASTELDAGGRGDTGAQRDEDPVRDAGAERSAIGQRQAAAARDSGASRVKASPGRRKSGSGTSAPRTSPPPRGAGRNGASDGAVPARDNEAEVVEEVL